MKTASPSPVKISHPDKVLFPESGITKQDLADYYLAIAPYMLPHLEDRPISMQRYPNGIGHSGFFQKEASDYFPDYIKQLRVKLKNGESKCYVRIANAETLVYLANQGNIPVHTWLSRKGKLNNPDMIIWDLDPSDGDFEKVRKSAFIVKKKLEEYGLDPWLKTTGSRGLHLALPIKPLFNYTKIRDFAKKLAEEVAGENPELLTTETSIAARGDKVFVDYLRNGFAQTAIAPYSVRAKENAPVAMPLEWAELKKKSLNAQSFNIHNALQRMKKTGDVWKDFYKKPYDPAEFINKF
jgi:bifunctional non-homologous end joining protein LigD